jgi:REP element-mobilizing transposase RayT
MPRANRHYLPGYVWHITHRCHQKEFLLKFPQGRQRYVYWLTGAKSRYGLSVLNYIVTANHIHLLVFDTGRGVISKSMQLIAGRTGQEYNRRENRKGAFWEDLYHATIVQTNRHLLSCMVYMDLNMVRAGVSGHPAEWDEGGYSEMLRNREGAAVIDRERRKSILGFTDVLDATYQQALYDTMQNQSPVRQPMWTESIAVGDEAYVTETKRRLSSMAKGKTPIPTNDAYALREPLLPYGIQYNELEIDNRVHWYIN